VRRLLDPPTGSVGLVCGLVEAGVQTGPDLLGGVRATLAFTARDDDTGRRDADDSGQTK
jgi:hypothetical protein